MTQPIGGPTDVSMGVGQRLGDGSDSSETSSYRSYARPAAQARPDNDELRRKRMAYFDNLEKQTKE